MNDKAAFLIMKRFMHTVHVSCTWFANRMERAGADPKMIREMRRQIKQMKKIAQPVLDSHD